MRDLKHVERREIHYASHSGGAAHPAFAPTPIDISAADLYDQVEDTIQDVAGDIGLWGGKAPQLLAKLAARMGRLADAPNSGRDYKQLTNALHRVKMRTTPPQDRDHPRAVPQPPVRSRHPRTARRPDGHLPSMRQRVERGSHQTGQGGGAQRPNHHLHAQGRGRMDDLADRTESQSQAGDHVDQTRETAIGHQGRRTRKMEVRHE